MSVKVHEAFSIDSFQDRLLWFDDFLGDQLQDEWRVQVAGAGTATVVDQQTGGIVRMTTGAVNGNNVILEWNNIRTLHVDKKLSMEARIKYNHSANQTLYISLYQDGNNRIFFYTTDNNDWQIFCRDGGVGPGYATGVPFDTDYHIYRIECFPAGEVHYFVDGVECNNSPITANIPDDATDFLQPRPYINTTENVAKSMDIDYIVVRQEI